jgi:hypothetical protein
MLKFVFVYLWKKAALTDSERKMNRSEVSSKWNKCRIYVGDQLDCWNELKEVLRVQTRDKLFTDLSKAKSIFIYFYASSPDAAAWMLKFVFVYDNNFGYEKITIVVDNIPLM